jgi:hypothetical protein
MGHSDKSEHDRGTQSTEDIESAISKLSKSDRVGKASELLSVVGGAAAGASAAGAVASAAGATTLLGSTTLAGALGGVFVATTPVGWIAGCALAGSAAVYGVSRMLRSGGKNDQLRTEIVGRLSARLKALRHLEGAEAPTATLREHVEHALVDNTLSSEQAHRIIALVESGKMDPGVAIERMKQMKADA